MKNILVLSILNIIFIPSIIIIGLIRKKSRSMTIKILIILSILFCAFIILNNLKTEKPDDLYIKMSEINNNQSLMGLSKEEVVTLLREPIYEINEKNINVYAYDAGKTVEESIFGNNNGKKYYEFRIIFDENDKVKFTSIKHIP